MSDVIRQRLLGVSKWGKFLAIVMMVLGGISALFGLFAFIIGALPGVAQIILGYFLLKCANGAKSLANSEDEKDLEEMLDGLHKYLFIQAIILIVGFVVGILVGIFMSATIFAILDASMI